MSSYVLLEQEDWFEDEMDFIRAYIQPDMNSLDIGANHGVYALSIANRIESGHVWAFEPTTAPREKLSDSILLNQFSDRITLVGAGLSDRAATATISISANSELNSLYGNGDATETIRLEALDDYLLSARVDKAFDFVKLDAEGEEIKILRGGKNFFTEQSPLIMFELKHGSEVNLGLIDAIKSYGYSIYRLLPEINILIEHDPAFADGYLLNLFACKPDRAKSLSNRGLLASSIEIKKALEDRFTLALDWADRLKAFPYAQPCIDAWSNNLSNIPQQYTAALSACLRAQDKSVTAHQRVALLIFANNALEELRKVFQDGVLPVWLLKIHVLHLMGARAAANNLAQQILASGAVAADTVPNWPFIPPTTDFLHRKPIQNHGIWLENALMEFYETRKAFSSYFVRDPLSAITPMLNNPNHGLALDRRAVLIAKRAGNSVSVPETHPLLNPASSPNADLWNLICNNRQEYTPQASK